MGEGSAGHASKAWWHKSRAASTAEKIADAAVHGVGLLVALVAGSALLVAVLLRPAPDAAPAIAVYVLSFIAALSVSLLFNLWPRTGVKQVLARLDQAAIFLFIAGTYTPFLSLVWRTPEGLGLTVFVWGAALIGITLKLTVPMRFGRLAILLYLAIGWSGVAVFNSLSAALPATALWLLLSGGMVYSLGLIFHLWEKLKFHNALWHGFVVAGASLHLIAMFDALVVSRW